MAARRGIHERDLPRIGLVTHTSGGSSGGPNRSTAGGFTSAIWPQIELVDTHFGGLWRRPKSQHNRGIHERNLAPDRACDTHFGGLWRRPFESSQS